MSCRGLLRSIILASVSVSLLMSVTWVWVVGEYSANVRQMAARCGRHCITAAAWFVSRKLSVDTLKLNRLGVDQVCDRQKILLTVARMCLTSSNWH